MMPVLFHRSMAFHAGFLFLVHMTVFRGKQMPCDVCFVYCRKVIKGLHSSTCSLFCLCHDWSWPAMEGSLALNLLFMGKFMPEDPNLWRWECLWGEQGGGSVPEMGLGKWGFFGHCGLWPTSAFQAKTGSGLWSRSTVSEVHRDL